jgi:hypothetical protein
VTFPDLDSRFLLFQHRQRQFADAEQAQQRRFNRLAIARVVLFAVGAVSVYFLGKTVGTGAVLLALVGFTAVYLALLTRHQRVRRQRDEARFLKNLNGDEAERLEGRFTRPETGLDFDEPHHPYTADLDVFGTRSLFRLLNRTRTHAGAATLASWLKAPAPPEEISTRQEAVRELSEKLDWRQSTEATAGLQEAAAESTAALLAWMAEPPDPVVDQVWFRTARFTLPALTVLLVVLWLNEIVPFAAVALSLLVSGLALGKMFAAVKRATEQTYQAIPALRAVAAVLERLVFEPFFSEKLKNLQARTAGAPGAVRRLSRTLDALSYRQNPYFALFISLPTLWDFQFYAPLERWKRQHRAHLPDWLAAVGELEALHSLAGLAFAEPSFVFPILNSQFSILNSQRLGHPLIPALQRVANDFAFGGPGRTLLVTGSNMSGKSTFLRTVGTNAVLALAGSVVCAEAMNLPPVRVFTSMRTQDSLEESTSSFYAELKRLRQLLETVASDGPPVLFLLDEILKGTNSRDRHGGARALIFQLKETAAFGLISTHDVELGDEAAAWEFVENAHFRSDLNAEGKLVFDYTLRPGVCHSFNAAELMRQMGIKMNAEC